MSSLRSCHAGALNHAEGGSFPYRCAASRYGSGTSISEQTSPICSGTCPPGHHCGPATFIPQKCEMGTYCPEGSATVTKCPAAYYGDAEGLSSADECKPCPVGFCELTPRAATPLSESRLAVTRWRAVVPLTPWLLRTLTTLYPSLRVAPRSLRFGYCSTQLARMPQGLLLPDRDQ